MATFREIVAVGGIGWIIAFIVFILCIVFMVLGKPVSDVVMLALVAGCALARLV